LRRQEKVTKKKATLRRRPSASLGRNEVRGRRDNFAWRNCGAGSCAKRVMPKPKLANIRAALPRVLRCNRGGVERDVVLLEREAVI
jgi:hypothetical protein